jgi:regulator of cell morphogenesis and NO signaling
MPFIEIQTHLTAPPATLSPELLASTPILVLVADFPRLRPLLDSYGLDTCCGGHMSVEEACRERGLDPAPVIQALSAMVDTETT